LTYSAPLYVDVKKTALTASGVEDPTEADWQPIRDIHGDEPDREEQKVWIGKVKFVDSLRLCRSLTLAGPYHDEI
jgi:DNA-directed RNA polymerase II subunit RPB2